MSISEKLNPEIMLPKIADFPLIKKSLSLGAGENIETAFAKLLSEMELSRKQFLFDERDKSPTLVESENVQKIADRQLISQRESVSHGKRLLSSLELLETDVEGFNVPHLIKSIEATPAIPVQTV